MRLLKHVDQSGFILAPRERPLIRAQIVGGSLLATDIALHILLGPQQRIEWWQINQVSFNPETKSLLITTEGGPIEIELTTLSLLPEAVRERVMSTILISTSFATPGQASAVISLRRRPSDDGEETFVQIDWQGSPMPEARSEAEQMGRRLQESLIFSSPLRLR